MKRTERRMCSFEEFRSWQIRCLSLAAHFCGIMMIERPRLPKRKSYGVVLGVCCERDSNIAKVS